MKAGILGVVIGGILATGYWMWFGPAAHTEDMYQADMESVQHIEQLVRDHARAWETGDEALFLSTIHEDIIFAYPGRRLTYDELLEDFRFYQDAFASTTIYIHDIVVRGDTVAVQWQFAATDTSDGKRGVASDAIIGKIKDGKIISWKEYLDGRVSRMQKKDALPLEEGEEPFPSPIGSLRNFCEITK